MILLVNIARIYHEYMFLCSKQGNDLAFSKNKSLIGFLQLVLEKRHKSSPFEASDGLHLRLSATPRKKKRPIFRFDVFTKTKTPAHQQFYTVRTQDELDRFVYIANRIEAAVNTGVFVPVESCINCPDCPYFDRCKAVHRKAG